MPVCTYYREEEIKERATDDKEIISLLNEVNQYIGTNFSVIKHWHKIKHRGGFLKLKTIEEPTFMLLNHVGNTEYQIISFCGRFYAEENDYPHTLVVTKDVIINYLRAYLAGMKK